MSWKSTVAYKAMKTDELDNVETWQEDNLFVDKMSALEILYGSQSTVSTQLMKSNYLVTPLTFPAW